MLDTPSLLAVSAFLSIFMALLVVLVWRRDRRYPGMTAVKIGLGMLAAGFVAQGGRAIAMPDAALNLLIITANVLLVGGSILTVNGGVMLAGARPGWRRDLIAAGIVGTIFLYYLLIEPATHLRILALGLFTAFLCFGAFFSLLVRHDNTSRTTRLVFAGVMFTQAAAETVRALGAGYLYPINDYATRNPVVTAFLLEYMFAVMALAVLSLQLVSERLQRDLQRSESRITSAFEVASDAFAVFDGAGRLVVANLRFDEIFPRAAAVRPGMPIAAVLAGRPEEYGIEGEWLNRDLDGFGLAEAHERVARLASGAWVHVSASMTGGGGLVLRWSDITNFKQAETVMANELARERELAAVQRSFVSMASHQFRTPLSIIDVNAQLIETHFPAAAERTGRVRQTVHRLISLIDVMLGAASAEAGAIEMQRSAQDPAILIREACNRLREISPDRTIDIEVDDLPPSILCDADLIDQVIGNLLSNAVKYSSNRQDILVRGTTEGDMAVIRITDFGVGIAEEDQPLIFDRFFRGRNTAGVAGTGVGLTLARYVVDLHGGDVTVQSKLGAGSTFAVRLPIA